MECERLERLIERHVGDFHEKRLNCAEAVLTVMGEYFDFPRVYPRIATGFGGGILKRQSVCGALTGGLMAIGLVLGREVGGDRTACDELGNRMLAWTRERAGAEDCRMISGADFADPAQEQAFRSEGGAHERVCEPLVADLCRWLAGELARCADMPR